MTWPRIDAGGFQLLTLSSADTYQKLGLERWMEQQGVIWVPWGLHRDVWADTERSVWTQERGIIND